MVEDVEEGGVEGVVEEEVEGVEVSSSHKHHHVASLHSMACIIILITMRLLIILTL